MNRVARMMLFARQGNVIAMVFGISFSVLLITHQMALFLGVLFRSTGPMQNIGAAEVWVTSKHLPNVMVTRGMREQELYRVRSIPGVAWAERFSYSMRAVAELPDGAFTAAEVAGIDRNAMVGAPPEMLEGTLADLRSRDAVIIEASRRDKLPGMGVGDTLRLNDRRARIVGVCRARTGLFARPLIYTTYENAFRFAPRGRNSMHWILVKVREDGHVERVCDEIERRLGLGAFPADQLRWKTMKYMMEQTSIGLNFLVSIVLGFLVGLVVSVAAFHQFTAQNLQYFALMKALGTPAFTLVRMVFVQGLAAGSVSYGIGVGLAALLSLPGRLPDAAMTTYFPWPLLVVGLVPMLLCILLGSVVSLWRVLRLDPVMVFQ